MTLTMHRENDGAGGARPGNVCLGIIPLALLLIFFSSICAADSLPPRILQNTMNEGIEPGVIKAMIMDDTGVANATLFYRKPGEVRYNSIEMKERSDIWYRELRRDFGVDGTVEYYILAQDNSGNESSEPAVNPNDRINRALIQNIILFPVAKNIFFGDKILRICKITQKIPAFGGIIPVINSGRNIRYIFIRGVTE